MDKLCVFNHHLYEYRKGLRNLILLTTWIENLEIITTKLNKYNIAYLVQHVTDKKINVFFGNPACINVLKQINKDNLTEFTPEEDYILGIMLGYDRLKQCDRYITMKKQLETPKLKTA